MPVAEAPEASVKPSKPNWNDFSTNELMMHQSSVCALQIQNLLNLVRPSFELGESEPSGAELSAVNVSISDDKKQLPTQVLAEEALIESNDSTEKQDESAKERLENIMAYRHLLQYLRHNIHASETIVKMKSFIERFRKWAPRFIKIKCIDGRAHGSDAIGYPEGTVDFFRTEGSKLTPGAGNFAFWDRIARVITDAVTHTPGTPALFIAMAHTADEGHGCAAQSKDEHGIKIDSVQTVRENSLKTVQDHVTAVRNRHGSKVYALHGMMNTDDKSECLYFANGTVLDSRAIIQRLNLSNPEDVYTPEFLDHPIPDAEARQYTGNRTVRQLLEGSEAPFFHNMEVKIAMEAYLMEQIASSAQSGTCDIIQPRVYREVRNTLESVNDLPGSLLGPLLHQTLWNIPYSLQQNNRLKPLENGSPERNALLEHDEDQINYGEGFELVGANKAVLAKTGRGDDIHAITVAKAVLDGNREKKNQQHKPIVHINVEATGDIDNWSTFNVEVLARLEVMTHLVYDVFKHEPVTIMTTYSHQGQKRFFPVQLPLQRGDPRLSLPVDLNAGLSDNAAFSGVLKKREVEYARRLLSFAEKTDEAHAQSGYVDVMHYLENHVFADKAVHIEARRKSLISGDMQVNVKGDLRKSIGEGLMHLRVGGEVVDNAEWKALLIQMQIRTLMSVVIAGEVHDSDQFWGARIFNAFGRLKSLVSLNRGKAKNRKGESEYFAERRRYYEVLLDVLEEQTGGFLTSRLSQIEAEEHAHLSSDDMDSDDSSGAEAKAISPKETANTDRFHRKPRLLSWMRWRRPR
ncbi:MAG: hypothetical protein WCG83_03575 [Candidatus Peregrinibacteria bacterium]